MRRRFQVKWLVLVTVLFAAAVPARAQVLRGRVMEDGSEKPIATVSITLLKEDGTRIANVLSDTFGRFQMRVPERGSYKIAGERIGYRGATSPKFQVGLSDTLELEFRLLPNAVLLAPLTVTASSRPWHEMMKPPGVWAFYERKNHMQKLGLGKFVTREQIDDWIGSVSTLLATVPGVQLVQQQGGASVVFRRALPGLGSGECAPLLFLNGSPVRGATIDELVTTMDLEGIEVYRGPSQLPGEFAGSDSACGVIALWTRRGG
jgi:hypothetical protein